jgi:peptidoglycan/LPS O-acetylase OafA/YrhL
MLPPARFRADLEGLRGVAILLVVLFHAGVPGFAGGFVGVDIFLVLSGFFITGALARELDASGRIDLNEFWGRRMLRLSPPLLLVLVATLAIVMTLYAPIDRAEIAGFSRWVAMYAGNINLASHSRDYFTSTENPLLHTWSLGVEEQFYILWPMLLGLVGLWWTRNRRALIAVMVVAGCVSLAACIALTQSAQPWAFYGVLTRVWEFALGGLMALCRSERSEEPASEAESRSFASLRMTTVLGVTLLAIALLIFDEGTQYPGYAALVPALAAVAFIIGESSWLSAAPLRWLGRVSYAWYLWHWPLVGLGETLDPRIGALGKVVWSVAALGLAWLTYRFVEGSARDGQLSRTPGDRLALYGVAASGLVLLFAWSMMRVADVQTVEGEQARFAAARNDRFERNCWTNTLDEYTPCFAGDERSTTTTIALLGDSHAEHWLGALDRAGKSRGWKIDVMVKGGCPVSDAPEMTHPRRVRHYSECARYREAMLQRILRERPTAVILSSWDHYIAMDERASSWQVTPEQWEAGLRRSYTRLTNAGIRVIVMRDVPRTHFDVPQCLSRRAAGLPFARSCLYQREKSISLLGISAQNRAARGLPVSFIDMNDVICAASRCSPVRNGVVVFTDDNHLTATFSRSVADILGARIEESRSGVYPEERGASLRTTTKLRTTGR